VTTDDSSAQKSTSTPSLADLEPPSAPLPILVRATDGNSQSKDRVKSDKIKLSTVVQPDDLETFFTRYADVCKQGMQALKKRDRSKRKKQKQAKKKPTDDKKSVP
jgi:signal recognition particle subunit SRP14